MRTAAADAVVLLKNDAKVLPLDPKKVKKIAIIGPNAKEAITSGGGSARLLSAYTVSPLEGIRNAVKDAGVEVTYTLGVKGFKLPPLLDPYIKTKDGKQGALLEFWNEEPSPDFMSTKAGTLDSVNPCAWSTPTKSTSVLLIDGIVSEVIRSLFGILGLS
jgi:beta-glucosidase